VRNKIKTLLLTCAKNSIEGEDPGSVFTNLGFICTPISFLIYIMLLKFGVDDENSSWLLFLIGISSIFLLENYFNKILKNNNTKNIKKSNYYPFKLILFSILLSFIDYLFYKI
jgi:hypothetical protein